MAVTMITGGARSGKSTYAEKICKESNKKIVYIACGKITDDDMEDRIKKHRAQRPKTWVTIEQYKQFDSLTSNKDFVDGELFLLDCITTMITNIMFDFDVDYDTCTMDKINEIEKVIIIEIDLLLDTMNDNKKDIILVTNEVGLGVVPPYRLGNVFRDISGRCNQHLARKSDEVICIMSGLPLKLK